MTQFVSARAEDETVLRDMRRMPLPPTQRCEDNAVWCMGSRLMKYKCYKPLIQLHYILGYPIMRTSVSHPLVLHNQNNFIVKLPGQVLTGSCPGQVFLSGLVKVLFIFNSLELDSEVGRLVESWNYQFAHFLKPRATVQLELLNHKYQCNVPNIRLKENDETFIALRKIVFY